MVTNCIFIVQFVTISEKSAHQCLVGPLKIRLMRANLVSQKLAQVYLAELYRLILKCYDMSCVCDNIVARII